MAELVKNYVIARYYFTSLFKEQADKNFIENVTSEPYMQEENFEYALGDFQHEAVNGFDLVRGTFGRVRKGTLGNIYDHQTKEFKQQKLPELVDETVEFLIEHKHHLIFIENNATLKPETFVRKFKQIYENTKSHADFDIDFIVEEKDVYATIQKWERVNKVSFSNLRPSNPSSLDDFSWIEEAIKETGSKKTNIEFSAPTTNQSQESNSSSGLNYESKFIKQSLALSAHGYGETKINGIEKGRLTTLDTRNFKRTVTIDYSQDGAIERIIEEIKRINKDEIDG